MNALATSSNTDVLVKMQTLLDSLIKFRPQIEKALSYSHGTHTFDDVVGQILANQVHFFAFDTAFVMMERIQYPQFAVYHCFLAGGELEGVLDCIKPMSEVATALGCTHLSMAGRQGWQRELTKLGWQFVCVTQYFPLKGLSDEQV